MKIAILAGDGIGTEIVAQAERLLKQPWLAATVK